MPLSQIVLKEQARQNNLIKGTIINFFLRDCTAKQQTQEAKSFIDILECALKAWSFAVFVRRKWKETVPRDAFVASADTKIVFGVCGSCEKAVLCDNYEFGSSFWRLTEQYRNEYCSSWLSSHPVHKRVSRSDLIWNAAAYRQYAYSKTLLWFVRSPKWYAPKPFRISGTVAGHMSL